MAKVLAVFGATGRQGSAVVDFVLNDHELSKTYKLRAITRDVNSDNAKAIDPRVEVVAGDFFDRASIETALTGVHTVFAMMTPSDSLDTDFNKAKTIADVAVEKGVEYFIFSTLPSVTEISGGKYTHVSPFDAKAKAEKYIRTLPIKSSFYAPGAFMQNWSAQPMIGPKKTSDGQWVLYRPMSPQTQFPMIDAVADGGKYVGAILADPEKWEGKTFYAATKMYTLEETVKILSNHTGENIILKHVTPAEFEGMVDWMPKVFSDGFAYWSEFGYYGPDSEKLISTAQENARGKLTTFEEFLEANPFRLE